MGEYQKTLEKIQERDKRDRTLRVQIPKLVEEVAKDVANAYVTDPELSDLMLLKFGEAGFGGNDFQVGSRYPKVGQELIWSPEWKFMSKFDFGVNAEWKQYSVYVHWDKVKHTMMVMIVHPPTEEKE